LTDDPTIANYIYTALDDYESDNYLGALVKIGKSVEDLQNMLLKCDAT